MTEPSLPEKIVAIHRRLDQTKIPHAFGGALALAYYAEPRATDDIDLNVFIAPLAQTTLYEALTPLGVSDEVNLAEVEHEGQCRLWWGRTPVDLFFANDEIHQAMQRETRVVPFGDDRLPVLAPEHLTVCKAVFDRPKDWLDIEQIVLCTEELDIAEIHRWLDRIVGPDDPRRLRFDQIADTP